MKSPPVSRPGYSYVDIQLTKMGRKSVERRTHGNAFNGYTEGKDSEVTLTITVPSYAPDQVALELRDAAAQVIERYL